MNRDDLICMGGLLWAYMRSQIFSGKPYNRDAMSVQYGLTGLNQCSPHFGLRNEPDVDRQVQHWRRRLLSMGQ
jgi:hypothetical protein